MKLFMRSVATAGLIALLALFTLGFLATFEPLPPATQWTWRAIYAGAAILDAVGLFLLWRPAGRIIGALVAGLLLLLAAVFALVFYLDWSARHGAPL